MPIENIMKLQVPNNQVLRRCVQQQDSSCAGFKSGIVSLNDMTFLLITLYSDKIHKKSLYKL